MNLKQSGKNNIKLILLFSLTLTIYGCSSKKEVVQGFDGNELVTKMKAIQGKTRKEAKKILGNPVIEGYCKKCKPRLYRMIYLTKDMSRFYLGLSYNTDQEIECLVLDFLPDHKKKEFIYNNKNGFRRVTHCNQRGGAIIEFQQILDGQ